MSDSDSADQKFHLGMVLFTFLLLGALFFGPDIVSHYSKDRIFAEQTLRASAEIKHDFQFVHDIEVSTGLRGSHLWETDGHGGYITFDVRGYPSLNNEYLDLKRYRVYFSRTSSGLELTRIESETSIHWR